MVLEPDQETSPNQSNQTKTQDNKKYIHKIHYKTPNKAFLQKRLFEPDAQEDLQSQFKSTKRINAFKTNAQGFKRTKKHTGFFSSESTETYVSSPEETSRKYKEYKKVKHALYNFRTGKPCSSSIVNSKFRNYIFSQKMNLFDDTHDEAKQHFNYSFFNPNKLEVVEIAALKNFLFLLLQNGLLYFLERKASGKYEKIFIGNVRRDEIIRAIHLNETNKTLVTISVMKSENYNRLYVRSTSMKSIENKSYKYENLFESENLTYPGFVEFDEANQVVITYSGPERIYKVWECKNYELLYTLRNKNIEEIKPSPGLLLILFNNENSRILPMKIKDIKTGETLMKIKQNLRISDYGEVVSLQLVEICKEKIILKQYGCPLEIIDVLKKKTTIVKLKNDLSQAPEDDSTSLVFLYNIERFLILDHKQNKISLYDYNGQRRKCFSISLNFHPKRCPLREVNANESNILVTPSKSHRFIFVFHTALSEVRIFDLLNEKMVAKIRSYEHVEELKGLTSLFYIEDSRQFICGGKNGRVSVWG
eukprot:maker-scaffold_11-snap-gene-8.37-mRNA-1 protein AED:0.00 eAED:0.00 QI:46/1/1/1/1/1/2/46/533